MEATTNQYHAQADAFLAVTGAKVSFEYQGHDTGPNRSNETPTAHFKVTISREGRQALDVRLLGLDP